jgi:hypothetical protein
LQAHADEELLVALCVCVTSAHGGRIIPQFAWVVKRLSG